ncbi:Protein export cytoplasm protein SecA ATPase RNA helicase [Candidatus Rhodobacter oscarellae]|uniref:Protein export cytoplasm protein SecA ATPase RNA helicase n=1 Tax=Candidatus Rhodobacter oscarellae TaxID=1675527 RepID=A0A0J9H4D0_9RHOB|nr:GNAT family N-acetyltransferase [Candidatus Rhodobacter lobularis]KMW60523.1 Protein export cytoplasm protein SecA ATPase RNA helicase [Candidatus Rhodobacter lobularis]
MTALLTNTPLIETENLILRAPQPGDWPQWDDFARSDRARYIGGPYTQGKSWRAFGHAVGMWVLRGFGSFIVTERGSNTAIGMTGPWFPADWPEKELGWTMWRDDLEGKGLMFEAASAARDFAFGQLGWDTAVSYIEAGNIRSVALAQRLSAVLDPDAPLMETDKEVLVYRHPRPEGLS